MAILAKPEQFDGIFDGMLKELDDAGAVEMEKQYTELVKDRADYGAANKRVKKMH